MLRHYNYNLSASCLVDEKSQAPSIEDKIPLLLYNIQREKVNNLLYNSLEMPKFAFCTFGI
jgi:hypothetical protein